MPVVPIVMRPVLLNVLCIPSVSIASELKVNSVTASLGIEIDASLYATHTGGTIRLLIFAAIELSQSDSVMKSPADLPETAV